MQSSFSLLLEEREVSHAEQQRMWGALRSSCIHIYRPYGESLIGPINKRSAAFEHQQHILSWSMRSKLRLRDHSSRLDWAAAHMPSSAQHIIRELVPWWDFFECLTVTLAWCVPWLALLCTGMSGSGSDQPDPWCIGPGSDRGLAV